MNNKNNLFESIITENIKNLTWLHPEDYKNFNLPPNLYKVYTAIKNDVVFGIFILDLLKEYYYFEYVYDETEKKYVEAYTEKITDIESLKHVWKERHNIILPI